MAYIDGGGIEHDADNNHMTSWAYTVTQSCITRMYGLSIVYIVPRATWKESTLSCGPDCDAVLVSKPSEYEDSTILVELV